MNDSDRIVSKDSIEILSNKPDSPKSFLEIYELGSLCQSKRQYQKALVYAKQGLQLSTELSNQDHKVMALVNIGCIYWEMSQLKKAMDLFQNALPTVCAQAPPTDGVSRCSIALSGALPWADRKGRAADSLCLPWPLGHL